jgi:hypothetical protein
VKHRRLETIVDLPLSVKHRDVWRAIGKDIIKIGGVYNQLRKDIRGLTNETLSQHILLIHRFTNYQSSIYYHNF